MDRSLQKHLRDRVRAYEDRKISSADLGREIFHAAREIDAIESPTLRQSMEMIANRITALSERALTENVHAQVLTLVDDLLTY